MSTKSQLQLETAIAIVVITRTMRELSCNEVPTFNENRNNASTTNMTVLRNQISQYDRVSLPYGKVLSSFPTDRMPAFVSACN